MKCRAYGVVSILRVLAVRADPQIAAPVIIRIAVDVIDNHTLRSIRNYAVKLERLAFVVLAHLSIPVSHAIAVPRKCLKQPTILGIN